MARKRANREGSIYRDGDYWCAAITLREGSRKKKRSKYQYVVREWLQEQKTALRSGYQLQDNNVRFSEFLDHFIKDIAGPTVKPKTLDSYRWLIESHIRPHLGHIPISKIDQRDIQDLILVPSLPATIEYLTVRHETIQLFQREWQKQARRDYRHREAAPKVSELAR